MADPTNSGARPQSTPFETLLGTASASPFDWPRTWDDTPLPVSDDDPVGNVQIAQAGPAAERPPTRPPIADSNDPNSADWRGQELVLPDGRTIPDDDEKESRSPTRTVMTPVLNLDEVAAAGRRAAEELRR